jgi:hypothetical protein
MSVGTIALSITPSALWEIIVQCPLRKKEPAWGISWCGGVSGQPENSTTSRSIHALLSQFT